MDTYDIVVVGGGIAGFTAAMKGAERGARVALVEKGPLGGQWIFNGRLAFRSVVHSLINPFIDESIASEIRFINMEQLDISRFLKTAEKEAFRQSSFWHSILEKKKVFFIKGYGRIVGSGMVLVDTSSGQERLLGENIIIASGSDVRETPSIPFDGSLVISGDDLLKQKDLPDHILVVGSEAEGCEIATSLRLMGCKVFLCSENDRILSGHDNELTSLLEDELRRTKIKLLLGKKVLSIYKKKDKIEVSLDGGVSFSVDGLWLCGERKPSSNSFKESGVRLGEHGEILTDEGMRTSEQGVYAIGSVTRSLRNSALSREEARISIGNALGKKKALNLNRIPWHIQTSSELVSVGCFANNAHHKGFGKGIEGVCDWGEISGKELSHGKSKVVVDSSTKQIIGCHLVAPGAGVVLPSIMLALRKKLTVGDFAQFSNELGTPFQLVGESARAAIKRMKEVE